MTYNTIQELADSVPVEAPSFRTELPDSVVKSAARTIQILEFIDHVRRDVSGSEVAAALNYPASSTSALLRSMVTMGYLQHDRETRAYRLTRRTGLLGAWVDPSLVRRGTLVNLADSLAGLVGETVLLTRRNELSVQIIYVADGGTNPAVPMPGEQHCVSRSAPGMALLAMSNDRELRGLIARINADRPANAPLIDGADYATRLGEGRRRGSYTGPGIGPGTASVARQLRHSAVGDMLVMSVEGPTGRMSDRLNEVSTLLGGALSRLAG
ncbi:helix-turn-helix domain-containing protein [Pseudooceanicola sp.]|uniref:IclR family transcriptional regulator n=1 Tax=Pseudooceanicola sp. TaxID=1914328 RepID=UPI00260A5DAC|nr:helix-turn-helix domain-containing protein [Pseudooceanicola sp.]MDF1854626.1 helix-turn-helix domain-containing protein [Pseudooceanicola sp.]